MLKNLKRRWQREERDSDSAYDERASEGTSEDTEQVGRQGLSRASTSTPSRDVPMSSIGTFNSMDVDEMKLQGPLVKRRKISTRPTTPVLKEAIGTRLPEVMDTNKALAGIEDAKVVKGQTEYEDEGAEMSLLDRIKEGNSMWILF